MCVKVIVKYVILLVYLMYVRCTCFFPNVTLCCDFL